MPINTAYVQAKEKIAKALTPKKAKSLNSRVPVGQTLTEKFPVLDLGIKPSFNGKTWRLKVYGLAEEKEFTYQDLLKMPATNFSVDFHCVTSWSKLDVKWKGVLFKDFLTFIKVDPTWNYVIQEGADDYTTNVSRQDLEQENVFLAYELDGKPIPQDHGWPVRFIIPHLYAWKGSKFLKALKFVEKDEPGFWEVRGYHNRGDAFKEERYG